MSTSDDNSMSMDTNKTTAGQKQKPKPDIKLNDEDAEAYRVLGSTPTKHFGKSERRFLKMVDISKVQTVIVIVRKNSREKLFSVKLLV
jgi:hypothetical protein